MLSLPELKQAAEAQADPQTGSGPKVIGYRRVWNGGCDHCQLASERLYFTAELAPIHDGCSCGIAPVFEGEKHDLFTTRKNQSPLPAKMVVDDPRLGKKLDQSTDPGAPFIDTDWLDKQFSAWGKKVEADEELYGALDQYAQSDGYTLNKALRTKSKLEEWEWLANLIDKALSPLPSDVRAWRGLGGSFEHSFGSPPKVGGVIHDDGFLSTTVSKSIAENFTAPSNASAIASGAEDDGTLIEVIATKGTPAGWLEPLTFTEERELLLGRGLDLEIVKVVNPKHIVVKVISHG